MFKKKIVEEEFIIEVLSTICAFKELTMKSLCTILIVNPYGEDFKGAIVRSVFNLLLNR